MCPRCGAEERLGVWLPRAQVRLFDRVKRAGNVGIDSGPNRHTFKAKVWHINIALEETDWKIRSERGHGVSCYKLVKR